MENLSAKTLREKFNFAAHPKSMLATIGHETEARLSCQAVVNGDCEVETRPELNWSGDVFWKTEYPNK
jgi:ferredoxin